MKILIVSNMYPSSEKPYAGIFVKNQFEEIRSQLGPEDKIDIFYMERRFTGLAGSVLKYLKATINFIPTLFRKYDLIHLHFFYPLIYLVWAYKKIYRGTRVVVTFHGKDITVEVNAGNQARMKKLAKCVDCAIPVGTTLAKMVRSKLALEPALILPVGVDHRVFNRQAGIAKIYDYIWIGSFIHRKGIDVLLKAIRQINRKSISFCFCGSGEYYDELVSLQKMYPITVRQNLTQPEIAKLINQARFLVLLSRNEGFPTATIEAMYCGVPVLTSDIPQFQEQVTSGVNGYMVPLENVSALVEKIESLAAMDDNEYEHLSINARNSFRELSLQEVCGELIKIYRNQTGS